MNPKMIISKITTLLLKSALILGINGSLIAPALALGGVGGLSLKKRTTNRATIVPMIAWHTKDQKISVLAFSLLTGSISSGPMNKVGSKNPTATPNGFATVAIVVAITL